jgi:hypothetical protein
MTMEKIHQGSMPSNAQGDEAHMLDATPTREVPQPANIPTREVGQTSSRTFGFGEALDYLRMGAKVARVGWNGKDMWLALQEPDANSKMTLPYIYMRTAQGDLVPWLASQTDVLSRDWRVAAI